MVGGWAARALGHACLLEAPAAAAAPEGTLTFAMHFSPVTRWLDPAEGESTITPYLLLYALHDGLLKPMPGTGSGPSLAESWSMAKDGLSAEFVLRPGIKFHNGDPITAEDVAFSFERYRGGAAKVLKDNVKEIQRLRPESRAVRVQGALARFPGLLRHVRGQRWVGGAQAVRRARRARRASARRRSAPVPTSS